MSRTPGGGVRSPLMQTSKPRRAASALSMTFCLAFAVACGGGGGGPVTRERPAGGALSLRGAGASFPNPLYQKWLSEYGKAHPEVRIDYQSIGSGGGIKQIKEQTIDFGASDSPMKDEDMQTSGWALPYSLSHFW